MTKKKINLKGVCTFLASPHLDLPFFLSRNVNQLHDNVLKALISHLEVRKYEESNILLVFNKEYRIRKRNVGCSVF